MTSDVDDDVNPEVDEVLAVPLADLHPPLEAVLLVADQPREVTAIVSVL